MLKLKKEAESSLRLSLGNARPIEKVKAEKVFELLKAHNSETMQKILRVSFFNAQGEFYDY